VIKFIDLFAGIGGFRLGMEMAGHECVGFVEIDKFARQSYMAIHDIEGEYYADDIRSVKPRDLPEADCYTAGFPCQSFSVAGKRGGFSDTRGTLFFEIMRLAKERKPKYILLENVAGLLSHDGERTFGTILQALYELGYDAEWQVLNSKDFGVPQNRERVFIIGHRQDCRKDYIFPLERTEIDGDEIEKVYLLSKRLSHDFGIFCSKISQIKGQELLRGEMQVLLARLRGELQKKQSWEIQEAGQDIQPHAEGNIQEIETEFKGRVSSNLAGGFCGVVSSPTEEMLLLWNRGERFANIDRQYQQQIKKVIDRQDRFIKKIREGQFGSLLLAVQSYQGRLFYSIGDGRDWAKVYCKEVGRWNKTLTSILEPEVDEKYFLSEEQTRSLLKDIKPM